MHFTKLELKIGESSRKGKCLSLTTGSYYTIILKLFSKLQEKYVLVSTVRENSKLVAEARGLVNFKGRSFGIGITSFFYISLQ